MPPDRYSSQSTFDTGMLDPQVFFAPDGQKTALRAIEAVCHRGDPEIGRMVEALNSCSHILEYIISVLEEKAYKAFSKWIVTGFPTSPTPNIMDTMSIRLLQRFSSSLLTAGYQTSADVSRDLRAFRKKVELSFSILKNIEENANGALTGEGISPTRRKKGKVATYNRRIDPLPFDSMGITVPTTDAEVRDVYIEVLSQLRSILEHYLLILKKPQLSEIFKSSYAGTKSTTVLAGPDRSRNMAFHTIQPMKATVYFDDIEGFGEWAILLSTRAQKYLRDIRCADFPMFQILIKKIKQLSQGHFSHDNQQPLTNPEVELPIYEAMITGDTWLVYQIDCVPDLRNYLTADPKYECQVIRIFGVFTHAQLGHRQFWDTFSQQLQHRGPDYIKRCTFQNKPRPLSAGISVILPAVFPPLEYQVQDIPCAATLVKDHEEDIKNIHSMLVLDKFVILSQALLNSILADKEVVHVFSVSAQEQAIIEYPSSCYVMGRSGTGKTTTILFKMLAIQRTWQQYPDMGPKPRQVFIARSQVLAIKVEKHFAKLMLSLEAAACSPKELQMMQKDVEQEIDLVDQDDYQQWRSNVPGRFSELLDEHFPLFITYDQLHTMLQNDIEQTHALRNKVTSLTAPISPQKSRFGILSSSNYVQQSHGSFVSYDVFLASYWGHFQQSFTRGLDPALVFGEFMGVIKGSESTIGTDLRCLDRGAYESLNVQGQGNFSHKRHEIYHLFLAYMRLKQQRWDHDAADRTHYILEELLATGLVGQKVDYLYIDEVQDNLLIDTLILRTICANQHGLFWAGDTAQTISIGSSFQFADLKAYQYRIEKQLSHKSGLSPVTPRTFELVSNYRSHGGIVNCARSIVELIVDYWPHSIDKLKPEQAIIDGFCPTFFSCEGDADVEKSFFGSGQGETTEFGADQCILVRNDAARDKLRQKLGNSIIMTLYESKGLEFNDVLLYNFFTDSIATLSQWRLVLNGISNGHNPYDAPAFDETRHASICIELKFLYVAITRARNNLWIVDSSESAEPMKVYWSSKDLIKIWSSNTEVPHLVASSTSEEWSKTGRAMFFNKHYAQASIAFQRAGRNREAAICDAYLLREKAQLMSTTISAARVQAFVTAANAFTTCAQDSPSKQINERLAYYGAAGECYSEARDLKHAGDSYQMAKKYATAARMYQEGGYFDKMVEIITQHNNALEVAEIHAKNGDMLKAVEILIASQAPRSADYVRLTIEYLLTGLRRSLTLGVPPASSPTVLKLLLHADKLDNGAMTEQEVNELAMFQAIKRTDHASLRIFAKKFVGMGNDLAALLCLDHTFSSPPELRNLPLSEVEGLLSLYFDYIQLLEKFRRDESLAQGSDHQRLFGFQVLGENRYLVLRRSILYEKLTRRSGSSKKGVERHIYGSKDLRRGITQLISARISNRTEAQDDTCRNVHGFSPCLHLLVEKKCDSPDGEEPCSFHHVKPEELTSDWYNARLRLILLQFQILNSAHCGDLDVKSYWLGVLYSTLHPPVQMLGSLANVDISNIPNGADSLGIVREWVKSVSSDSNRYPGPVDRFRQWFIVAGTLAFDLDRENARSSITRTSLYRLTRERDPIVQDYITLLTAETGDSLTCGSLYLCHVLRNGSRVDLNALCDLAERLSGLFIMAYRANSRGVLHDVTLPRSWFINLISLGVDLKKDTLSFATFASTIIELMQWIDTQVQQHSAPASNTEDQFIADGNLTIDFMGPLYISRICMCLCLMGYNTNEGNLKKKILAGIQSLRRGYGQSTPWIYQRYAAAERWGDLVNAFAESLKDSSLDEMILLLHATIPNPREQRLECVRQVSYDTLDGIPQLLISTAPRVLRTSTIPVDQGRQRIEVVTGGEPDGGKDGQAEQEHVEIPPERIADGERAEAVTARGDHEERIDERLVDAAKVIQDAYRRHWERKRTPAARKIQAAYRRYLKRKDIVRQGINTAQAHYWQLLRKRSLEMGLSKDSRYYILFRFPLAYILVCLDVIKTFVESKKEDARERVVAGRGKDLEELKEALSQYSKLLKKTIALQRGLAPSSEFHKGLSVCDLQHAVLDVKAVVEALEIIPGSIKTRNQIREHWSEGWKWIFEK